MTAVPGNGRAPPSLPPGAAVTHLTDDQIRFEIEANLQLQSTERNPKTLRALRAFAAVLRAEQDRRQTGEDLPW